MSKKQLIYAMGYGRNSGRFKLWLGDVAKEIVIRKKITIATTGEDRAEIIIEELLHYGLNLKFNHLYEGGKYTATSVFL